MARPAYDGWGPAPLPVLERSTVYLLMGRRKGSAPDRSRPSGGFGSLLLFSSDRRPRLDLKADERREASALC